MELKRNTIILSWNDDVDTDTVVHVGFAGDPKPTQAERDEWAREHALGLGLQSYNELSGRGTVTNGPTGYCQSCLKDFAEGHHGCQCD
jgi:hypothetical protein